MPIEVGINGAAGRMGRLLLAAVLEAADLQLLAAVDHPSNSAQGQDVGPLASLEPCGVSLSEPSPRAWAHSSAILDFSLPAGTEQLLRHCGHRPLVVGTTGLSSELLARLREHSQAAPVVFAPNFSTGIALLSELVSMASRVLDTFDMEVVEAHHRHKLDAPSGTALHLASLAAAARGLDAGEALVFGRHGDTGERPSNKVGVHSIRGGGIVGEHRVLLAGSGEYLELKHVAIHRGAFAQGALRALRWVVDQPPGFYGLEQVLGLPGKE